MLPKLDFVAIIEATREDLNALSKPDKIRKLMEEVGELSKASLAQDGVLKATADMESLLGEAADVILMVIDIVSAYYPEIEGAELSDALQNKIYLKYAKWATYMKFNVPDGSCLFDDLPPGAETLEYDHGVDDTARITAHKLAVTG